MIEIEIPFCSLSIRGQLIIFKGMGLFSYNKRLTSDTEVGGGNSLHAPQKRVFPPTHPIILAVHVPRGGTI